jgi:endonuclease YncB( thermonuclease family)
VRLEGVKERKAKKARKGRWQIDGKSEWAAALPSQRYFLSLF